jgi:hypothetical protein
MALKRVVVVMAALRLSICRGRATRNWSRCWIEAQN